MHIITIDPTHIATPWEAIAGYPLHQLDGREAHTVAGDLTKVRHQVWLDPDRYHLDRDSYKAAHHELLQWSYAIIDHPRDAIIRIAEHTA